MAKIYTAQEIRDLITNGKIDKFYNSHYWRVFSKVIIKEQNNECQFCKARRKVTTAYLVHHVQPLKLRPDLAYSRYYVDEMGIKRKQLIASCFNCHEETEGRAFTSRKNFINVEKW